MMNLFNGVVLFGVIFVLIILALAVLIFIFWISMLVDCIKRKFKEDSDKIIWIIVIIFTGVIGASIYYFIVKTKDKKKNKKR